MIHQLERFSIASRPIAIISFALLVLCGATARADDPALTQQAAMAALLERGSVLIRTDDKTTGQPVVAVDFAGMPGFQDEWLKFLQPFPRLADLNLASTGVGDTGIAQLKGLREIESLNLSRSKITDTGLAALNDMPKLRRLNVRGTAVTAEALGALRKAIPQLKITADVAVAEPPAMTPDKPSSAEPTFSAVCYSIDEIRRLRKAAARLTELSQDAPEGWSKSRTDAGELVKLFKSLQLRKGFALRAYQFSSDGNRSGAVWAMPADAAFPEPKDCPTLNAHLFKAPKPAQALDDVMDAIEGDDSLESYMLASLLWRELCDFGAAWHGLSWTFHTVLADSPWKAVANDDAPPTERPSSPRDQWTWKLAEPKDWNPQVRLDGNTATVTFYTFCGLYPEKIFLHTDTYTRGKYRAKVDEQVVAEGKGGFRP